MVTQRLHKERLIVDKYLGERPCFSLEREIDSYVRSGGFSLASIGCVGVWVCCFSSVTKTNHLNYVFRKAQICAIGMHK